MEQQTVVKSPVTSPWFITLRQHCFPVLTTLLASVIFVFPAQATISGVTPGEFSVDESGGANYQIPLAVPPGTSGMQPP